MEDRITAGAGAIALLQETAKKTVRPEVIEVPNEPSHVLRFAMPDGTIKTEAAEAMPRGHTVESLESLILFANKAKEGKHGNANNPVAWYGEEEVLLVTDDNTRRDYLRLRLHLTDQFSVISERAKQFRSQKDFLRFVKIDLAGTLQDCSLINKLKKIVWTKSEDGNSTVEVGKSSMGKTINSEVRGVDVLPEEITVNVRVFENVGITSKQPVRMALDVDEDSRQFRLVPLPMQIEQAIQAVVDEIARELQEGLNDIPLYRGSLTEKGNW